MTTLTIRLLLLGTALAASAVANPVPVFTFSTAPSSGDITGAPGQTIGWGYSITNKSSADYLVFTNLDAGAFLHGAALGLFDFPIVAPGQTVTESFDAGLSQGLYELTLDSNAPNGFVYSADFTIRADWYNGDPFAGGTPIAGLTGVTATVGPVGTPEPSVVLPVLACMAGIMVHRKCISRGAGHSSNETAPALLG